MPRTSRPLHVHPIVLRRAEVVEVADVSPNMRRITLSGPDLEAGTMGEGFTRPPFVSDGFDDHVKLIFPPVEGDLPPAGTQEETRFRWNPAVMEFTRDYTVRAWDRATGTFAIDVVRHERGLAAEWAFRAEPGDQIDFAGPKSCAPVNYDVDWHLLVGDETALPAIGRWLEEAPPGARAQVIVEVPTALDRQEIRTEADVQLQWLVRGDAAPGTTDQLLEAIRALPRPPGRGYVWCAGEAQTLTPVRRYLRREVGLPKEDVEVVGYWRRPSGATRTGGTARPGEAASTAGDTTMQVLHEVHEMTELLPPVVSRVAATLGIGGHVAAGTTDLAGLAGATGIRPDLLRPLLEAMQALGLLEIVDGRYGNTPHGAVLAEAERSEELSLDNPLNLQALALVDLLDVLRTGAPSPRREGGAALEEAARDKDADESYFVLEPIGRIPVVASATRLAVAGPSAQVAAPQIAAAPAAALRAAADPTVRRELQVLTDPGEAWGEHDCAVLLAALEPLDDERALHLLRTALGHGPALVLVERNYDQVAVDDHAAEAALTALAVTGVPPRTGADLERLLREAGASTVETSQLGWGFGAFNRAITAHG